MRVFISSTSSDLKRHREVVRDEVLSLGWTPEMMEYFGTTGRMIIETCEARIRGCDLVVVIIAWKRGDVPSKDDGGDGESSYTALELREARRKNLDIICLMANEGWPIGLADDDKESKSWIKKFRNSVGVPAVFFGVESDEDLPAFRAKLQRELCRRLQPQYETSEARELSELLRRSVERKKRLEEAGQNTSDLQNEINNIKRRIRKGASLQAGDVLQGRFLLIECIGNGGFAQIWKAIDQKACEGPMVAVKILHGQHSRIEGHRQQFFRGAKRMSRVEHEGVVQVILEEGEDDGFYFFVTEYLSGGDLRKAVLEGKVRSEGDGLQLVYAVGEILQFAHERGLIHGNIKPENILLDSNVRPKLTDFDSVYKFQSSRLVNSGYAGSVLYAAPELLLGPEDPDISVDIYGLAMTAVFLLHGRDLPPKVLRSPENFVIDLRGVSQAAKMVLVKALALNPQDRYSSVADFCTALTESWKMNSLKLDTPLDRPYVREVLLIVSAFDAFLLGESRQVADQIFQEHSYLLLPSVPHFTYAYSGEEGLRLLNFMRFDLVVVMTTLDEIDDDQIDKISTLTASPLVLLALGARDDVEVTDAAVPENFNAVFFWRGDPKILLVIVKYIEDRVGAEMEIESEVRRVIIVAENSPYRYSSFLVTLYHELTAQALGLSSRSRSRSERQMYMTSKPRVLHALTYKDGMAMLRRFSLKVIAVVCSINLPLSKEDKRSAGLKMIRGVKNFDKDLPTVMIDNGSGHSYELSEMKSGLIDTSSEDPVAQLRSFLFDSLGFGDFIFKNKREEIVGRARDLGELESMIARISDDSLEYHARKNHFSVWLFARNEFKLADMIRPKKIEDFDDINEVRGYLKSVFRARNRARKKGMIVDFSRSGFADSHFVQLGGGSLGGKGRGLEFWSMLLHGADGRDFCGIDVLLPKTLAIGSDFFDEFLVRNSIDSSVYENSDKAIRRIFLNCDLPAGLVEELRFIAYEMRRVPIAVRSSSFLEETLKHGLAGLYTSLILPSNASNLTDRLDDLIKAIKIIYSSVFYKNSRAYLGDLGVGPEDEHLAILIQEAVGQVYGTRFYPTFSGVAQSRNFYPVGPQEPEDGIVHLALGFGITVVDGGQAVRFSPRCPGILPQFWNIRSALKYSQRSFMALDLLGDRAESLESGKSTLREYSLAIAEDDGALSHVGSVVDPGDQQIRDTLRYAGPRIVTFNNVLKHKSLPLPEVMSQLLSLGNSALGRAVEIEFAGNLAADREVTPGGSSVYVLQMRPLADRSGRVSQPYLNYRPEDSLCLSTRSLGNGSVGGIRDVICVRYDKWSPRYNEDIVSEVDKFNMLLRREGLKYILIGPGRWGTSIRRLGIPVQWSQISNAKVVVEASPVGYDVEPSQGFHFFHNMTSLEIGYIALPPGADGNSVHGSDFIDLLWLDSQPPAKVSRYLRWIRFEDPLVVVINGQQRRGVVAKPGVSPA